MNTRPAPLLGLALLFLSACASLWPTPVHELVVDRSTIDPPAAAILQRVVAYAEAEEGEDPRILQTAWTLYSALNGPQPIKVKPWEPLATGGILLLYYETKTTGDPELLPQTAAGRVEAAKLLGEALSRVLTPQPTQ